MVNSKNKIFHYLFIILFFVFNILNCYLITSGNLIDNLLPYLYNPYMLISSFMGNFCILLIILGIGYICFKNIKRLYLYLSICTLILSGLFFAMSVYCNYYGMMFDLDNLAAVGSETSKDNIEFILIAIPNLIKLSVPFFFVFTILLFILFIVYTIYSKKEHLAQTFIKRKVKKGLIVILIALYSLVFVNFIFNDNISGTNYEFANDTVYSVQTKGILNHYTTEFLGINEYDKKEDSKVISDAKGELLQRIKNRNYSNEYTNIFNDKNLLLIQLESINNFLIGLEIKINGEYCEVTPNLNKLVRENVYFDNFYTTVGIGNTADSELSVMTGLYPLGYGYVTYEYFDNTYQTLPNMFKEDGYKCYSFHANTEKFYRRNTVFTDLYGFNNHFGSESLKIKDENMVNQWLGDEYLLKQAIDMMKSSDKKTFIYGITVSNHTPFSKPFTSQDNQWFNGKDNLLPEDFKLVKDKSFNRIYTGYLEYVNYTDYAIGKAIEYLKKLDIYDDTVIILYGDHGIDSPIYNMFYESQYYFRNSINEIIQYGSVSQKLLEMEMLSNVPLIIVNDKLDSKVISTTRGNVSLQSTIANLFGLKQKYSFAPDCFSDEKTIVYNSKNGIIFMDDIIINSRTKKCYNHSGNKIDVDKIIKDYQDMKDLNNKILYYDLLKLDAN